MFKLNLKIALRNLWKYKGYTSINVFGLAIGLASCILIFIFVRYQLSFDKDYANGDRIYRMVTSWKYADGNEFYSQGVPLPLPAAVRNDFSQFEKVAAIQQSSGIVKAKALPGKAEVKKSESIYYAEPSFFEIFDYKWLAGNPNQSLTAPNTVVLSEKAANTYFGDWRKAIGNTLILDNKTDFKVTGIIKDNPQNSSFPLEIIFSYVSFNSKNSKDWGSVSSSWECYVLLKKGVLLSELDKPIQQFLNKYENDKDASGKVGHTVQPLKTIHHNDNYGNFANKYMPYKQIIGLVIIGLFLLLTACINFINLATAQAISRSKEVGVRKVMGSRRKQLIWQFLSETALITFIALLLACVLSELTLPKMENLFGGDVTFSLFGHPIIFVFLLVMLVVVSFLAGLYPALIMSGFSPALAIKNKVTANAGGVGLRKTLVVVQFAITAILIIGTLVVIKQMSFIRNKSLGFDTQAISLVSLPQDSLSKLKYNGFKERLSGIKGVKNISFCSAAPSSDSNNETSFTYNSSKRVDFQANVKAVDEAYFKTFGLQLIAGRPIAKSDTIKEFVVNETLIKKLNVKNPNEAIGKIMTLWGGKGPIVGVVKDFNNYSLHEKIAPMAMFSRKSNYRGIAIKLDVADIGNTMKQVESTFNTMFPDYVYENEFFDENLKGFYETEQIMGTLFKVFASVVIFISFIGLFGLISFVATQRTKEIAIRKVLGASNLELIKMLNNSFLWMVLIANMVAWPVAYIFVKNWLAGFEYRIDLSIWPFIFAMLISMSITIITVTLRSYRAAKANTIDALKYE
ncbi:FtsX-like permease family protein [Pedobacter sp. LMG 31464]|uniref:FtsX-like permease family protein n=1 Tax=Pedobacter planticolens TaxID=2679964 RepID=A0A923DWG9_9SPHI|nr:ABC transporter permease [Pedobacter planticolens]MBB2144341.1 FtsX-like permease family protein [Pedobacter planticolens]